MLVVNAIRPDGSLRGWPAAVLALLATAVVLALASLPVLQLEYHELLRLRRGENVVARWSVTPREWASFLREEEARDAEGAHRNELRTSATPHRRNVEIIIGRESVMVDDDFLLLPSPAHGRIDAPERVEGSPPCLEFHIAEASAADGTSEWTLRVPVGAGAGEEARKATEYWVAFANAPVI